MSSGRSALALALVAAALVTHAGTASAGRHKVRAGQTLGDLAERYGCSIASLRKANRLRGDRILAGQVLTVPRCQAVSPRAVATPSRRPQPSSPRRTAEPAASQPRTKAKAQTQAKTKPKPRRVAAATPVGESVGKPWKGRLRGGARLPQGKGYLVRRPLRSYGTPEMVATVREVIRGVRAEHRELHTLAIGDLSQRGGGRITEHRSHQSGRDIDVGFFYTAIPAGYPSAFAVATEDNLDTAATWDLLAGFARTADDAEGVEAIFLDYGVQGLLYEWAKEHGVAERYLDRLFQYPDGPGGSGLVRHEAHHDDHLHVRFRCPKNDAGCL